MNRVSLLVSVVLAFLYGCSSPSAEEVHDFRYEVFLLELGDIGSVVPIVLWEGDDGSRFEVDWGRLHCQEDSAQYRQDFFSWSFSEPDGSVTEGMWDVGPVRCELVGPRSVNFIYESTGESIPSSEFLKVGSCLEFTRRLPGEGTWWAGKPVSGDPPIPEAVVLPDLMPVATYRKWFCD